MESGDAENDRKRLTAELDELERAAGISESDAEKAWSGSFIPFGAMGDDLDYLTSTQNRVLYYDDEHDAMRRKVRKMYFGVPDLEKRKALIAKVHAIDRAVIRSYREDLARHKHDVDTAKRKEDHPPWGTATFVGVACVLGGYWIANTVGGIAGAVVGVFGGMQTISNAKRNAKEEVAQAQELGRDAEEGLNDTLTRPRFFNAEEEFSGEEDKGFSRESAFANRLQGFGPARTRT